ncbi:hypothetical protein CQ018_05370 [Arthrobacter sp. MYb227]|uniref:HelD family protein n=1 Tax=Arthrobacter sp. MYb227 TaxID=1848601 RepID=UPI000CFB53F5|nr:UvrD-helicase domain-containing protein [Arthrobacter sp. MYb227]PQZ94775.1 hypothetical protein CQ018_05370 [Arthrobacter sp. MYb227]
MQDDYSGDLAKEQTFFDETREVYESNLLERKRLQSTMGSGPERRAMKTHLESAETLQIDDAIAIGRVELDDGDHIYVGKVPILSEDGTRLVISWKAPFAKCYYQATTDDQMGLKSKRIFSTSQNHVESFEDTIFVELAARLEDLGGEFHADDALLQSLAEGRTGQMQDIVRTIQASQDKLMRADIDQLLIIQGGPGTGKTAVALHRASWLLYNYGDKLTAQDLLVVGPNPAFTKYIQHVLPALGDKDIRQTSVQELMAGSLPVRGIDSDAAERLKGRAEMADVIANGLNDRIKVPSSPLRIRRRSSAVTINIGPELITDDVNRLRHLPYGQGRGELRERLLQHCLAQVGTRGEVDISNVLEPASLEAAVDKMWPKLSGPQFIRELLGSKNRLRTAIDQVFESDVVDLLYRSAAARMDQEPWTLADLALIDEANENMTGSSELYGHIIVDEAQDLSPMQLMALRRRSKTGSMTIVGDVAQSTGAFARADWADIISSLKSALPYRVEELEHGYRVPREVFDIAARLLPIAAPDLRAPIIVRAANAIPTLFDVPDAQLALEVAKVASHHSGKGRFVGVIAQKERWDEIKEAFSQEELIWSDSSSGQLGKSINLVTPSDSKGLEFDSIIVVDPQRILEDDNGERLLYIALTRTTSRLDVLCPSGRVPELIADAFTTIKVIDNVVPTREESSTTEVDVFISEVHHGADYGAASMDTPDVVSPPVPTPAGMPKSREPMPSLKSVDERNRTLDILGHDTDLSPVEQELVRRNALYLSDVILKFYGTNVQLAILSEALNMLKSQTPK